MPKYLCDEAIDGGLNYLSTVTEITICNAEPTDYTKAHTTYMLCAHTLAGGDWAIADDTNGRKNTLAAQPAVAVTNPGTAIYVALTIPASSKLVGYTLCTSKVLGAGDSVNIPAFKDNVQDPT
jgi:hypothetical protein